MMGSGWLIRPDLLATAGHVVYDWKYKLGPALELKCYIGYNGRASVDTPEVQTRFGKRVVTTTEWIESNNNRHRDISFIQVNAAFTGKLRIIDFVKTPESDQQIIGVVGYPGDKYTKDETNDSEEIGAQMYEQFKLTDYDLKSNDRGMLEYKVSTFGGK
jgi:V8-like Glu-specific endopeptidase